MNICRGQRRAFSPPPQPPPCVSAARQRRHFSEWRPDGARAPTHSERGAFAARLQGEPAGPPITSLGGAKRAIQFLKAAVRCFFSVGGRGQRTQPAETLFPFFQFQNKSTSTLQFEKVFLFFLFIKCEITCQSQPSGLSAYVQNRHHSVITSVYQTQQISHLCTYIHKLKGQSMVVGTYLFKR